MSYRIELAQAEYIPVLPLIEQAAAGVFPEEDLSLEQRSKTTPVEVFETARKEKRLWTLVDEDTNQPIGFALLEKFQGQLHVKEIDVHPGYSRKGLGTQLLNTVISWARGEGYEAMTLTTFRHLPWNAPFYKRFGFVVLDPTELSPDMEKLFKKEATGSDVSKRVMMQLDLLV